MFLSRGCGEAASRKLGEVAARHASRVALRVRAARAARAAMEYHYIPIYPVVPGEGACEYHLAMKESAAALL